MVITLVGLLGLLEALTVASQHNLKNQMRDEAVQIAEQQLSNFMAAPFTSISSTQGATYYYSPQQVASRLRGVSKSYTVSRSVNALPNNNPGDGSQSRELVVKVHYRFKDMSTTHEIHSMRVQ